MPTPQDKLKQDLRRVRKLEELIQHPKLSPEGKNQLETVLRMQKAGVRMRLKVMTAPGAMWESTTGAETPRPTGEAGLGNYRKGGSLCGSI